MADSSTRYSLCASLRHPVCIFGILLFFINNYADEHLNVPMGEFGFLGLILASSLKRHAFLNLQAGWLCLGSAIILALWSGTADYYHDNDLGQSFRVLFRITLFYMIIIGYMMLPEKRYVFILAIGFTLGYVFNFFLQTSMILLGLGAEPIRMMKYILPTPAIILLMVLFFQHSMTRSITMIFCAFLAFALVTMPLIGSRGAFLSLFVAAGFYALGRIRPVPTWLILLLVLYLPFIPITVMATVYNHGDPSIVIQWLYDYDLATLSNVERSLMAFMNITTMMDYPWLGVGSDGTPELIEPYYTNLTDEEETAASSPHNFYMESAVPFGLPTLLCTLVIWSQVYRMIFRSLRGKKRAIASYICAIIAWIMLYQPVAGITRMDVFILVILGLFHYSETGNKEKGEKCKDKVGGSPPRS